MILNYSDFKKMTKEEMKQIKGGYMPVNGQDCYDTCPSCPAGSYCDDISCGMTIKKGCVKKEA
jgi:bacteriocin-like protein